MDVEYTGRHDTAVTDEMRAMAGPFLDRMEKMLGGGTSAHVVVTAEKNRQVAEVTVKTRAQDIVGESRSDVSLEVALRHALEKAEAQVIRSKEKRATKTRLPKDEKAVVEPALERGGKAKRTALLPVAESPLDDILGMQPDVALEPVHHVGNGSGDGQNEVDEHATDSHVTRSIDAVALRPMSLEEAIKELETRHRELFVFRDREGLLRILHCKRDGLLELIELP